MVDRINSGIGGRQCLWLGGSNNGFAVCVHSKHQKNLKKTREKEEHEHVFGSVRGGFRALFSAVTAPILGELRHGNPTKKVSALAMASRLSRCHLEWC